MKDRAAVVKLRGHNGHQGNPPLPEDLHDSPFCPDCGMNRLIS